jgi:hypothetical protein
MWFSTTYTIEYDTVVGYFSSKEVEIKFSLETSTLEAMVARGQSIERGEDSSGTTKANSNGKKDKGSCCYCNKLGHLKKDCWKRKEFEEDARKEENRAEIGLCMVNYVLYIFSISQYQEEWLLYFGASHHMCSHRSWFSFYQSISDGVVLMGNDISCVGIGSIKIKMFDGIVRC